MRIDAVGFVDGRLAARATRRVDGRQHLANSDAVCRVGDAVLLAPLRVGAVQQFGGEELIPVQEILVAVSGAPDEAA